MLVLNELCMKDKTLDTEKKKTLNEYLSSVAPEVSKDFRALRASALKAGPLDSETLELILLTSFATVGMESAFKGHAKRSLTNGLAKEKVQHALVSTLGATLPMASVVEALRWLDDL